MQSLWKTVWNFFKKLKTELPYESAIPLLGIYPKNTKTPIQKNLCTPVFITALLTIAKCWKQPKCPLVDEWIKIPYDLIYKWNLISKTKEQNRTRDMEIKNKLAVTRREGGGG